MFRALSAYLPASARGVTAVQRPLLDVTLRKAKYSKTTSKKYEDMMFQSTHSPEKYWGDVANKHDSIAWYVSGIQDPELFLELKFRLKKGQFCRLSSQKIQQYACNSVQRLWVVFNIALGSENSTKCWTNRIHRSTDGSRAE